MSPARNAPRATERPTLDVNHAIAKHNTTTLSRKSSRERVLAIW